jgi:hypothetical protein
MREKAAAWAGFVEEGGFMGLPVFDSASVDGSVDGRTLRIKRPGIKLPWLGALHLPAAREGGGPVSW